MKIRTLLTGLALAGLLGCGIKKPSTNLPTPEKPHFASLPMNNQSGMAIVSGDFDKDGDLDVIVGVNNYEDHRGTARLYFLENDGEGNFKLKQYPNVQPHQPQEGEQ